MRLSIFNFSRLRDLGRIPFRHWLWMLVIAICAGFTYLYCVKMITAFYPRPIGPLGLAANELSEETEVVMLCSSHGFAAVNVSYMEAPLVNLSLNSGNYEVQEVLLRSHLDKVPNLKYAIIELENTCLALDRFSNTRDFREVYELGGRLEFFPRSDWWKFQQQVLDHKWVKPIIFYQRITPYELIYIRKKFYSPEKYQEIVGTAEVAEDPVPINRHNPGSSVPGHGAQLRKMDRETLDEIADIQLKPDIITESRLYNNADAFERMIVLLIERGIQPVFIRFPVTYAYNRWSTPEWRLVGNELETALRETLGPDFMLWEFTFEDGYVYEDFADSQHLNKWGAIKFSQQLDEKIRALPALVAP